MAESSVKIDNNNPSINEDQTIIVLNKQIHFTITQIEHLLKLKSFINVEPRNRISLISSILRLENIDLNNINFWLADTLAAIVKNIQVMQMSVLQGTTIIRWILHFMSLVVGEEKLSKIELFENLRKCIKFGLANAEEFMIPLPNNTECPKYVMISTINSAKFKKSDLSKPVTAVQMATFILDTIRDIFWDDFKYAVIQMAFEVDSIKAKELEYCIRHVEPLYQNIDDSKNNEEVIIKEESNVYRNAAIVDRYFLRKFDRDIMSLYFAKGLQRPFCSTTDRYFDVSDDAILPLSVANLTKNAEKYIEKLRIENLQNVKAVSRMRSMKKKNDENTKH